MALAQIFMIITLVLMVSGRVPLYMTAIIGSSIAALIAGFPISGSASITISKLVNAGLNPVIADMAGVLLFIGIMERVGFLNIIIKKIMEVGRTLGGGPGVATAGGIAAGMIGALTGFTQPAITAVITGPAAVKLGVDPSKVAAVQAHAGHLGNFGGFTHPTMVAVVATAAIGFGKINVVGAFVALSIFAISYWRLKREESHNPKVEISAEAYAELTAALDDGKGNSFSKAIIPFILLIVGFSLGYPVFVVGAIASISVAILAKYNMFDGEKAMMKGVDGVCQDSCRMNPKLCY